MTGLGQRRRFPVAGPRLRACVARKIRTLIHEQRAGTATRERSLKQLVAIAFSTCRAKGLRGPALGQGEPRWARVCIDVDSSLRTHLVTALLDRAVFLEGPFIERMLRAAPPAARENLDQRLGRAARRAAKKLRDLARQIEGSTRP